MFYHLFFHYIIIIINNSKVKGEKVMNSKHLVTSLNIELTVSKTQIDLFYRAGRAIVHLWCSNTTSTMRLIF